jgi:hypothetical protein
MKSFSESELKRFLTNQKTFDIKCLEDLFLLSCVIQQNKGKLAIWLDTDSQATPFSIEIYDDEFNILDTDKYQSDFFNLFTDESDFVYSELRAWDEDEGTGQYEVGFNLGDLDLNFINGQKTIFLAGLEELANLGSWHVSLKEFIQKALSTT